MLKIVQKQKQELIIGLADLFIKKESVKKQIDAQRVAIEQCNVLIKEMEEELNKEG